jgi:hypothetical protein
MLIASKGHDRRRCVSPNSVACAAHRCLSAGYSRQLAGVRNTRLQEAEGRGNQPQLVKNKPPTISERVQQLTIWFTGETIKM